MITINLNSNFANLPCESIGKIIKKLMGFEVELTKIENEYFEIFNNKNIQKKNNYREGKRKAWETRRIKAEQTKKEIEDLKKQIQNQKEDLFKRDLPIGNNNRNFYNYNSQNTPSKNFDPVFNELILKHEKIIGQ